MISKSNSTIYKITLMFCAVVALCVYYLFCLFAGATNPIYREQAQKKGTKVVTIVPRRGNLYSADGALLATTITKYQLAFDPCAPSQKDFDKLLKPMCDSLSKISNNSISSDRLYKKLKQDRKNKKRFCVILNDITYGQYLRISKFPLLEKGQFKGGRIYTPVTKRFYPMGEILSRTIGKYEPEYGRKIGLEYALQKYLAGKQGRQLSTKIRKGKWKPIGDMDDTKMVEGLDVVSTIDINMQDIAHQALKEQLEKYQASHGCAVLMEVGTGDIKAIVNLMRSGQGEYYEGKNHAVGDVYEPGSVFKLATLVTALEEAKIDTSYTIDTKNGAIKFGDYWVRDDNMRGYGVISLSRAMEVSSNTAMASMVNKLFHHRPEVFISKLKQMKLDTPLGVEIQGEGKPMIPSPGEKNWDKFSLESMSRGYGLHLTPLHMLAFYNAIANDGVLVRPKFVSQIKQQGKTIEKIETEILEEQICSKQTVSKAKKVLENIIRKGTGTAIYSPDFSMAGKSGTSRKDYGKKNIDSGKKYIASFAGFFPSQEPKYSCIVVIHEPNPEIGYYGSVVAAPVFKTIAQKIYTSTLIVDEIRDINSTPPIVKNNYTKYNFLKDKYKTIMPRVEGVPLMDAIPLLENMGAKVDVRGSGKGKVTKQSKPAGEPIAQGETIAIYTTK